GGWKSWAKRAMRRRHRPTPGWMDWTNGYEQTRHTACAGTGPGQPERTRTFLAADGGGVADFRLLEPGADAAGRHATTALPRYGAARRGGTQRTRSGALLGRFLPPQRTA